MAHDPISVYERLLDGISQSHWLELADLYAEDCVVEMPFALPEPVRILGREAVRQHFTEAAAGSFEFRITDRRLHQSVDPEVVIGEFGYDGLIRTTGRTFAVANVQVVRVRDGLIHSTRDYHDHARLAQVFAEES